MPYHGRIEHDKELDHLENPAIKAILVDYFVYVHKQYGKVRNGLIIFALITCLGCAWAIYDVNRLSRERHKDAVAGTRRLCETQNQNRHLLKQLVDRSSNTPPLKATPGTELYAVIQKTRANAAAFQAYADKQLTPNPCNIK